MKTITLPVYRRPDRLRKVLETLRACRPEGYTLYVQAEPGHPEVVELVQEIDFLPVRLEVNRSRLGLNANIFKVLSRAMGDGSEFNVALEDDIVLAPDAFRMAEWFRSMPDRGLYASLGFFAYGSDPSLPHLIRETQDFRSWGYCFTRESWEKHFIPGFKFRHPLDPEVKHQDMWDFWIQAYFLLHEVRTLHPALSRSNHLGLDDGTNQLPEIRKYFEQMVMSDGSCEASYTILKAPPRTWEVARKMSRENLGMTV